MKLVKPEEKYLKSYIEGCKQMWNNIHDNYIIHNPSDFENRKPTIFSDYENNEKGINLPNGFVPHITFWIVENEQYIGTIDIRLELSQQLYEYGGIIGIVIIPDKRGKGIGLKAAKLALEEAKELNISPIILTCEEDNEPSKKILERLPYVKKELYETFFFFFLRKVRRYSF